MELAEGIRKIGFRRWHERQLLVSHLYLATSLLSVIAVFATIEAYGSLELSFELFVGLVFLLVGSAAAVWSFVHYIRMLAAAQYAAERSICARCKTYGLLEARGSAARVGLDNPDLMIAPTQVRCRKCGNEWTIA